MTLQGNIKRILPEQVVSEKFKKREVHVEIPSEYPQVVSIEFTQDKTSLLDNFAEGQQVEIAINLRGREWTNPQGEIKVFNTLQGWRINSMDVAQAATAAPAQTDEAEETTDDDLPY
jgi:translation initiation factor IF-3